MSTSALSLADLRAANIQRDKEWNIGSEPVSLSFRGNELAGETGEACNILKKLERERLGIPGSRSTKEALADELADIVICADLTAMDLGIDLGAAVGRKFDETSEKYGLTTRLARRPGVTVPEDVEELIGWLETESIASRTPDHDRDNFTYAAGLLRKLVHSPVTHQAATTAWALQVAHTWLEGALACKEWPWDAEQRAAAADSLLILKNALTIAPEPSAPDQLRRQLTTELWTDAREGSRTRQVELPPAAVGNTLVLLLGRTGIRTSLVGPRTYREFALYANGVLMRSYREGSEDANWSYDEKFDRFLAEDVALFEKALCCKVVRGKDKRAA